jgi:2-polyprenyl-6-methoxyphenol hydroxylase-like FAD-dependent oxidoreductase
MESVLVVGAGPAGMMLAYQLASNGIAVRVLERHKDFDREFRGEFVQPSVLSVLQQLGIFAELQLKGQVFPIQAIRMRGKSGRTFASNVSSDGTPVSQAVHQPSLLKLLHEQCQRFPHYRLDLGAPVSDLVKEAGRVRGVIARLEGVEKRVDGRLVVVCNGRTSSLRKAVDLEAVEIERPYELLWLRFDASGRPELYPDSLEGYVRPKSYYVLYPTHNQRVQLMWRRGRKYPLDVKAPAAELKTELLADAPPAWHGLFEALFTEQTERQLLKVVADHLRRWWAPGVLFIGDAAHTMSPMGAQGLNMAVRDSIVAANQLVRAHRGGEAFDDALLARVETERRPEIERMQAVQARMSRVQDAPPLVQALLTNVIIPLATKLQGSSYLREIQYGVTDVRMEFPVPLSKA